MARLKLSDGVRLDPKRRDCADIVRFAAKRGFKVFHYPSNHGEYRFRHRLGIVDFFVCRLSEVKPIDLDVFQ